MQLELISCGSLLNFWLQSFILEFTSSLSRSNRKQAQPTISIICFLSHTKLVVRETDNGREREECREGKEREIVERRRIVVRNNAVPVVMMSDDG